LTIKFTQRSALSHQPSAISCQPKLFANAEKFYSPFRPAHRGYLPLAWNGNPHPQIYKALIKLLSLVFTQSIQLSNIVEAAPERGRANLEIAN
jgi:hypothetical protein